MEYVKSKGFRRQRLVLPVPDPPQVKALETRRDAVKANAPVLDHPPTLKQQQRF